MGGFSIWHWLIVLVIVVLIFGTKRLKNAGKDLGEAVKSFKQGVHEDKPAERLIDENRSDRVGPDAPDATVNPDPAEPHEPTVSPGDRK